MHVTFLLSFPLFRVYLSPPLEIIRQADSAYYTKLCGLRRAGCAKISFAAPALPRRQEEKTARAEEVLAGKRPPVRFTDYAKGVRPVIEDGGFKVNGRDTGAFYTEDDAKANADQMASYMSQMILPVMMLDADVKDNRARFF